MAAAANVATALVRALVGWLFFYAVIVAHTYVIWKWQTPPVEVGVIKSNASEPDASASAEAAEVVESHQTRLQFDKQLQEIDAVSIQLQQASQISRERNVVWKRTLEQWQDQYDEAVAALSAALGTDDNDVTKDDEEEYAPALDHLRLVLMRTDLLVEETDESKSSALSNNLPLAELLAKATEELDALEWTTLLKFIRNETALFPHHRQAVGATSVSTTRPCINYTQWDNEDDNNATFSAALEAAQQNVIRLFLSQMRNTSSNQNPLPVSFPVTVHQLHDILNTSLSNATNTLAARIRAASKHQSPLLDNDDQAADMLLRENQQQCGWSNEHNQVLTWLEAGLDAMDRKRDLRTALLQALADDDIDTSRLILDAELPTTTTNPVSNTSSIASLSSTSLNLRYVLDTPTLHESAILVDWFLHWINGRNDALDELLDRHVYSYATDDNDNAASTRIGPMAVEQLLQWAGHVQLPLTVVDRLPRSKTGLLRH